MNCIRQTLATLVIVSALLALISSVPAAEKAPAASSAKGSEAPKKGTRYPIHGKLAAVDKAAKTFTIKGAEKDHVFKVNSQTKIIKHGVAATLADAVVGEDVGGYVEKQDDGSVLALSVRFGPKPDEAEEKEPVKKPEPTSKSKASTSK